MKTNSLGRLVALSAVVGIVAGVGALAFNVVLDTARESLMVRLAGYVAPQPGGEGGTPASGPTRPWVLVLLPAAGALVASLFSHWLAPEAKGEGTDSVIDAFHRRGGVIRQRIPFVKTIATALTIGSGGSAGREGPIGQIGAGFGSAVATWLKTSDRERRLLMMAGAGAGIGAVFRAPLGAAIYAAEVLYSDIDFEAAVLVPGFVASIVAYSIYCGVTGHWGAIFTVPELNFRNPLVLLFYVALGVVCAAAGWLYCKLFHGVRQAFGRVALPSYIMPALGGLAVGLIGFFVPQVLGMGYGWVQQALDGQLPLKILITVVLLKMLATSLTVGSGGSGGMFAPSVVIGGLVGATVGTVLHQLVPTIVTQPSAFVLVGMAGFFAGVAKVPVAALIMVSEMATGYGLLVPLMLTTAVAYVLMSHKTSIYENQVHQRIDSPAHEGEFVAGALERLKVREALPTGAKLVAFHRETPLGEILTGAAESKQMIFPVLNDDGTLLGLINFQDIRLFVTEHEVPPEAVVAQDLLAPKHDAVGLDEDLASALRRFRLTRLDELPVVDAREGRRVVAVLGRRDIINAYHDRLV